MALSPLEITLRPEIAGAVRFADRSTPGERGRRQA